MINMNEGQMKNFIESIGDVDKKHGETEQTILHIVSVLGNSEAIRLLIKKNANLSQKNKAGLTALDLAILMKNKKIIQLLTSEDGPPQKAYFITLEKLVSLNKMADGLTEEEVERIVQRKNE